MSNIVETYRRSHPETPQPRRRRWLALGVVLGLMFVAGLGATVMTGAIEIPAHATIDASQSVLPAHAPSLNEKPGSAGDIAVGSTSKLPRSASHGILDGPVTGLIIIGIGLMTGLMVYLGLGRLLPAVNTPDPHPYELVRGRKEITNGRRYHGGPIRD